MSNPLAIDAYVPRSTDVVYYLQATKEGIPVNRQVPRTYQRYVGTGGTLVYDGSDEIRVDGSSLTSPLIIQLGPADKIRNWVGRLLVLNIYTPNSRTITLNSSPALMVINSTGLTQLSHVIGASTNTKSISVYFSDTTLINVDYGSSAIGSIIPATPGTANIGITYIYGTDSVISLPLVYIPDSTSYDVILYVPEPTRQGSITSFTGVVTGPGTQSILFSYRPAPRRTLSTTISGYLSFAGNVRAPFSAILSPILTNVFDKEYITGAISNGTLAMYDPLVNPGGIRLANDANGSNVTTVNNLFAFAIDLADSLVFYVASTSTTIIRWKSYTTGVQGVLVDVSALNLGVWNTGDTIVDMDFDDLTSSLLVLPSSPTAGKILSIPIKPYNNSTPNTVNTGVLLGATFNLGSGTVLHAIAINPFTRAVYVACKPLLFSNSVYFLKPFPDLASPFSYQHPTIVTGRTAMTFTSAGTLMILYEATLQLVKVNNARPLGTAVADTTVVYTTPQYHTSLSRNCYGWSQA